MLVCTCLMDTLLLSTSLCTAPASTMMPTALIFSCHFIIMSPLFIRPPPRSLSRFLSFILSLLSRASLFYFSNSTNPTTTTPLDPFLCLTVPMLVISALSGFFSSLFDLNFLISSLIYVTLLGFVLNPSPGSSRDVPHRFCFCSSVFILFFSFLPFLIFLNLISAGTVFSEDFFSHKLFPMFFFFSFSAASLECTPSSP